MKVTVIELIVNMGRQEYRESGSQLYIYGLSSVAWWSYRSVNGLFRRLSRATDGEPTERSGSRKMGVRWLTGFARSRSSLWEGD